MGKTLILPLKKQWFDMIKVGVKKEEYREISEFWRKRLVDEISLVREFNSTKDSKMTCGELLKKHVRKFDKLVFTLGYPKADDTERRFHAQTTPSNQLFNNAIKVLDGVSKLKERNAELEKENESLKYSIATLETDLAMAQSWRTTTPPVGADLLVETAEAPSHPQGPNA